MKNVEVTDKDKDKVFPGQAVKFNDLFYENVGFNSIKFDLMSFFIFILYITKWVHRLSTRTRTQKQWMPPDEAIMRYMGVAAHVVC